MGILTLNNESKELWKIGNRRLFRVSKEYQDQGYFTIINPYNHKGVDIIVVATLDRRIIKVIECTNYAREDEYINNEKLQRYIEALNAFTPLKGIEKEIIISASNIHKVHYKKLREFNIRVLIVGKQD
jgi:hypothetical protein